MGLSAWQTLLFVVLLVVTIAVLFWAPTSVGFGMALLGAVAWCLWLERHPVT